MKSRWGFFALMSLLAGCRAEAATQKILVDKGHVSLKILASKPAEDISYVMPSNCPEAKLEIKKSSSQTAVTHTGQECQNGAQITIPLVMDSDIDIELQAGVLEIKDEENQLGKFTELEITVVAGTIHTKKYLASRRTANYAGQKVVVLNKNGNNQKFKVTVAAGLINY